MFVQKSHQPCKWLLELTFAGLHRLQRNDIVFFGIGVHQS